MGGGAVPGEEHALEIARGRRKGDSRDRGGAAGQRLALDRAPRSPWSPRIGRADRSKSPTAGLKNVGRPWACRGADGSEMDRLWLRRPGPCAHAIATDPGSEAHARSTVAFPTGRPSYAVVVDLPYRQAHPDRLHRAASNCSTSWCEGANGNPDVKPIGGTAGTRTATPPARLGRRWLTSTSRLGDRRRGPGHRQYQAEHRRIALRRKSRSSDSGSAISQILLLVLMAIGLLFLIIGSSR